jgi:hypothetical protein
MDNLKQTETVKKALEFEVHIANAESKLKSLKAQQYSPAPTPPICETVNRTYPTITPQVQFNWALAIAPSIFFWPWIAIYYFGIYKKDKEAEYNRIKNSAEYKAKCAAADAEFDKQQEELNRKYKELKWKYDNETMPKYKQGLNIWLDKQQKEVSSITIDIKNSRDSLNQLYSSTKIIPLQYRKISALKYFYELMSTSDYDIKQAIELYDRQEQRKLDQARLYEQQQANYLANEQNALLDEQNDLIDVQNEISAKAKRDSNIANVAGFVQRHNTNKTLNKIIHKK